ncbi:MAG: RluA family pseudouridine synthase [Candidatus Saccharimonadales bacterium]
MSIQQFKTNRSSVGTRADVFIAAKYPQFARSSLKSLFDRHSVKVNGKETKPGYKLRFGDKVSINEQYFVSQPKSINLPVIYEDDDVVVINKPAGILTHSNGALNLEPTVASFISGKINDKQLTGNRAGIVHRLDRATSGVIICGRNLKALEWLQKQFSGRKAKKIYLAVIEGVPEPKEAIIDAPIGRNPKRPQTFKVSSGGRPAQTRYKILKKIANDGKDFSLLELKPLSGRTHQIRVHLAYIGHPVVGDRLYGHGDPKMLLYSQKLELTMPNGQKKTFTAPAPRSFKDFLGND